MSKPEFKPLYYALGVCFIFLCFYLTVAVTIILPNTDLARHVVNGRLILEQGLSSPVLSTNFYSYTNPDHPFVNHHWLSGVVFFLTQKAVGFTGLHLLYILTCFASVFILMELVRRRTSWKRAVLAGLLISPFVAFRVEVRPEMFTYLFTTIFFVMLWSAEHGHLKKPWLWVLPTLMLVWVNLHIGFVIGLVILGYFSLRNRHNKFHWLVWLSSIAVCFVNPNGVWGALEPFLIMTQVHMSIVENAPVWTQLVYLSALTVHLQTLIMVMALGWSTYWLKEFWETSGKLLWVDVCDTVFILIISVFSIVSIRNLPFFGLVVLPLVCLKFGDVQKLHTKLLNWVIGVSGAIVLLVAMYAYYQSWPVSGVGLNTFVLRGAEYFLKLRSPGPIFNNFDTGGYLDYLLYDPHGRKVFIDNRPEAYPKSFSQGEYNKLWFDDEAWKKIESRYAFGSLVLWEKGGDAAVPKFVERRKKDPAWKLVYDDGFFVIFVRPEFQVPTGIQTPGAIGPGKAQTNH